MKNVVILNRSTRCVGRLDQLTQTFIDVLLGVAGGHDYQSLTDWYHNFEHYLHWPSRGEVLGSNQVQAAQNLGTAL